MEILVCIKQVPGSNKVEVDPVTGVLKRDGADSKMNPYDLYALEVGLELREQYGGKVSVLTMGPPQAKAVLYEAFAMGADEGALITDRKFGGADVLATSYTLSQGIKKFGKFDLILCGLQTTDGDTAQVGPEVSETLGIPCVCNVSAIGAVKAGGITVMMDMPEDIEEVKVSFPCLLTVQKDIMQPRLPSYKLKKATESRGIQMFTLQDMEDTDEHHYGLNGSPTQVQRIFPPTSDKVQQKLEGTTAEMADQLYRILKKKKFTA
ncbi:MAG: electron transfer flavoprotein subunit beta/FixA family protein [Veillonellaceae bacterium]|jgi:electron transfer flavoprotein beta subunit|uniref:electron transfer flavoprotein subunit beta/FixA family protein n=1 Tax=uncultured Selenomonas sp. TaxID=159275 RepID=UPI0025D416B3|nr:electron transfer flavoprotein subunit beta/FixA family protein [uncultured Selenomonas sp.]MCI7540582.1 electron transfer flavoprotein subunit beta/FixA family protein [Veillonellaceae bacterium]MDD6127571.1 electron transfer flavoprotein subunit beta/FixA family protein [Veillonellaceae bacterium]MDD6698146.1 electron transfer flavoprotein subunit beta/FixA family protein [Veillonellaceae bacterium]MDY6349535.1 electron transfer flavoprotein subunit beta/FixA family protein [Selenomonas sp